jgi:hypothetical protein
MPNRSTKRGKTKKKDKNKLDAQEAKELLRLEKTVREGIQSYIEVGNALRAIKKGKLYREKYKSFDKYCLGEWGFTRSTAHDYLHALAAVESVGTSVQIDLSKAVVLYLLNDVAHRRAIVEMTDFEKMRVKQVLAEVRKYQPQTESSAESKLIHLVKSASKDVTKAVEKMKSASALPEHYESVISALESALNELRQIRSEREAEKKSA